jgi:AraC-like DNA-binding protein
MPISLSNRVYWDLFEERAESEQVHGSDSFDVTWLYPSRLGRGFMRQMELRKGIDLMISQYQLYDNIIIQLPEREHPIEYSFVLAGSFKCGTSCSIQAGQYLLCGSGAAPVESTESSTEQILELNVHIEPEQFLAHWQHALEEITPVLPSLIQSDSKLYLTQTGTTTLFMQTAVQQILQCPFHGITKRMYLESKVWELLALLIEQEMNRSLKQHRSLSCAHSLKPDDVDRIHYAREILLQRLDNPPSLIELARQVGLNDCTLKRGFRQVFGQTAFGLLHDYRLEQARQLLEERRLNVTEVARAIGFANRSYFASAFRKKFGVSPREYLARYKNSA